MLRRHGVVVFALAAAAVSGCDLADSLLGQREPGEGEASVTELGEELTAGPPMARNLSNREYLNAVSDLIGERLPLDLQAHWTATTQFSGFDAVPWSNLDAKAVRDLSEALEGILDRAVLSSTVRSEQPRRAEQRDQDGGRRRWCALLP
jgi:hypothetical protein